MAVKEAAGSLNLEERVAVITEIFTLPDVIVRLEKLTKSPDSQASDISRAIEKDVAMAAKVLKIVNSSFYGFNRSITSINYAVVILGFNMIRNLIMSVFFAGQCKNSAPEFSVTNFWSYVLNSAIVTDSLAKTLKLPDSSDAFIAGLFNKIGVILLNQYWPDDLAKVVKKSRSERILLTEAEESLLGFNHCTLGAELLERWNMPKEIVNICREVADPSENSSNLCRACHLANVITQALCLGDSGNPIIQPLKRHCLSDLNLPLTTVPTIMEHVLRGASESESFLSL